MSHEMRFWLWKSLMVPSREEANVHGLFDFTNATKLV